MKSKNLFGLRTLLIIAVILIAVPVHYYVKNMTWYQSKALIRPGQIAPQFMLRDETGKLIQLFGFLGKPVLLTFCRIDQASCTAQARELNRFAKKFTHQGLEILYLANSASVRQMQDLNDEVDANFYILRDIAGNVASDYGVESAPVHVFVDKTGVIAWATTGRIRAGSGKIKKLVAFLVEDEG
jgi:peroxiredoxin